MAYINFIFFRHNITFQKTLANYHLFNIHLSVYLYIIFEQYQSFLYEKNVELTIIFGQFYLIINPLLYIGVLGYLGA